MADTLAKHFGLPASTTLIQHHMHCTPTLQQPSLAKMRIFHAFMEPCRRFMADTLAKHFGLPASTTLIQHHMHCTPTPQQPGPAKIRIFHAFMEPCRGFMADTLRFNKEYIG